MGSPENAEENAEENQTKNRFSKDYLIVKFPVKGGTGKKLWDRIRQLSDLKVRVLQNFETEPPTALGGYLNTNARLVSLGVETEVVGNHLNFVVPRELPELVTFLESNLPKWAKVKKRLR